MKTEHFNVKAPPLKDRRGGAAVLGVEFESSTHQFSSRNDSDMLEVLLIALLVLPAAFGQTYFLYRYWRYSPGWRVHPVGRSLMIKAVSLAILVDTFVVSVFADISGNETLMVIGDTLEVLAYLIVTAAIWWQVVVLIKTQNRERSARVDDDKID